MWFENCSVADYEEKNHMTPDNLATVICPNLLRAPNNNFALIMKNMGAITALFKALLTHVSSFTLCVSAGT
jgi:GTPase-activating protein BEM2